MAFNQFHCQIVFGKCIYNTLYVHVDAIHAIKKNRSLKISNLSAIAPSPSDPTRHFHVDMIRDIIRDILIILGHLIIKEYY